MSPVYFALAGVEFANNARTETYARAAGYHGIKSRYSDVDLASTLGGGSYSTPDLDSAPWYDPTVTESGDFHGVFINTVAGGVDSTLGSTPVAAISGGGRAGRQRKEARTLVYNAVLLGASDEAVQYGLAWLSQVLASPDCSGPSGCEGETLQFFASNSGDAADLRAMRRVGFTVGPTATGQRKAACGTRLLMVTFTAYVGDPSVYGVTRAAVTDWTSGSASTSPGVTVSVPFAYDDPDCPVKVRTPLYDPLRPAMSPPPQYPEVPVDEYDPPTSWTRRTAFIPGSWFPDWAEVVPVLTLTVGGSPLRNARFRFYPSATGSISDQCGWTDDMLFTYVPASHAMTVDGAEQAVYAYGPAGARRNADSLMLAGDGSPLTIPVLSCGTGYVVAFDLASGETMPSIDLSFLTRNAIQAAA